MGWRRTLGTAVAPGDRPGSVTSRLRPGYLIIGTKRGGTTSLSDWILRHHEVAPSRSKKGTHYFDINYGRGPRWYFSRFNKPANEEVLTGEASPYYMYHPAAPDRIADTLPEVKIICVLRNPVERTWSQYRYEVAHGRETQPLEKALELEPERIRGEREKLLSDIRYAGYAYRRYGYLERGHYAEQLSEFYRRFPASNILVLSSEALFYEPRTELRRVWRFLNLSEIDLGGLKQRNVNPDTSQIPLGPKRMLVDYFRPHNQKLKELTGLDFGWSDDVPVA